MSESYYNKTKIIEAMIALMSDKSLEAIRTVDICTTAGISRQTFYRCFDDKYDAAIWFLENAAAHSMRQIGVTLSWRTGHKRMLTFILHNKLFMTRLFQNAGASSLGKVLVERVTNENIIIHYKEQYKQATGKDPDDLICYQIEAFAKISTTLLQDWPQMGSYEGMDDFLDKFLSIVPRELYDALDIEDCETSKPVFIL